ncbi:MAG: CHAD domain-containing protein [Planctomycetota bacterium]
MARSSNTPGKWTVVDGERMPARHVAMRTLRQRLDEVWAWLPKAGSERQRDPESVHQLRVATRRALAALEAFRDLLPEKQVAWFEKQLRRIRRAASDARDLDVLTDRLAATAQPEATGPQPRTGKARARLVAMLSKQRESSRQPIRDRHEKLRERDWAGRLERLLENLPAGRRQSTFGTYARRRFRPMIRRFFAAADHRLRNAEELHELRIEGKKLRYAMEIFASVFPPAVRARCTDALERLQKTLGDFTDHAAAADRFRRWANDKSALANRDTLERLQQEEEALADEARRKFSKWWSPTRRRGLMRRFEQTLRRDSA